MQGHFCEFQICKEYERCCGDNICCSINNNLLDLLFVTLVTTVVGMVFLGILYKYREKVLILCQRMYRILCRRCTTSDYTDMGSKIHVASSTQSV